MKIRTKYYDMTCSIYRLIDPGTKQVMYVGATTKTPEKRLKQHLSQAHCWANAPHRYPTAAPSSRRPLPDRGRFCKWLMDVELKGQKPLIEVAAVVRFADAAQAEADEIAKQLAEGAPLLNRRRLQRLGPYSVIFTPAGLWPHHQSETGIVVTDRQSPSR